MKIGQESRSTFIRFQVQRCLLLVPKKLTSEHSVGDKAVSTVQSERSVVSIDADFDLSICVFLSACLETAA